MQNISAIHVYDTDVHIKYMGYSSVRNKGGLAGLGDELLVAL